MAKRSSVRKRWKNWETWLANFWGGQRAGPTGKVGPDVIDIPYPLSIEAKSRQHLPKWMLDAIIQAKGSAVPGTIPVVIWHKIGDRGERAIVTLELEGFAEIMRRLKQGPAELEQFVKELRERYADVRRDGYTLIDAIGDVLEDKGYVVMPTFAGIGGASDKGPSHDRE